MSTFENQTIPQNRFSRIGERVKKNQGDIVIVISFVLIALISFGVGYLSAPGPQKNQMIIEAPEANILQGTAGQPADMQTGDSVPSQTSSAIQGNANSAAAATGQGTFVASKSGTKYYWPWSSYAKRIKPENLVWFKTESEAQKAGYAKSADFDSQAPAGYVSR